MVRKCIKSHCLEDTISSMVFKLTSFRIFFLSCISSEIIKLMIMWGESSQTLATSWADTRGLVSEQPRPCKKCVKGQRAFRYGVKSADRWWPQELAEGLFYHRKCGRLLWLHHSGSVAPLHAPGLSHPTMLPSLKYLLLVLQDPAQLFFQIVWLLHDRRNRNTNTSSVFIWCH